MSSWIEFQEVVVTNPVYIGPGSQILNSWMFDAVVVLAVVNLVYWGMSRGVFPRP